MSLKPGYKQTEIGVIPDDWETVRVAEILRIRHGKNQSQVQVADGAYPILASGGEIGRSKSFLYDKPSVLIGRKGTIDKPQYMESPFWTVDTLFFSEISPNNFPKFVYYKFCSIKWRSFNEASGVPSLNAATIENIVVSRPPPKEQKAIAEALSDVDALIDSLEALLTKKQNIKTGVMQELLTGRTRLPGFAGDWREVRLGDFALVSKGSQLPQTSMTEHGMYPHLNGGISPSGYTDQFNAGPDVVAISEGGNSCGFVQFVKDWFWSGGHCYTLQPNGIDRAFLYHALKGQQSRIMKLRVGSGLPNVQKSALMNFVFAAPKESKEQAAIAEVFSDIDDEIEALEKRLAKTRDLKQGMAQELLTGRTRLV